MSMGRYLTPSTKDNHLGLELEFFGTFSDYVKITQDLGELNKFVILNWEGFGDGEGWEAKFLFKQNEYRPIVEGAVPIFAKYGSVGEECGMHVHIDMRARELNSTFQKLAEKQDKLFGMCAPWRHNNIYCRRVPIVGVATDYYAAISARPMYTKKTIEVRMHESTFDVKNILSWLDTIVSIID